MPKNKKTKYSLLGVLIFGFYFFFVHHLVVNPNNKINHHSSESSNTDRNSLIREVIFDSTINDNTKYIALQTSAKNLFIINDKNDTVYNHIDQVNGAEFIDFNDDGFDDILFHYITNVPDINDLALFDSTKNKFIIVKGFDNYPASIKLKGTDFYYSYHRSGCADANWESDLFYIKNFKTFRIGNISGIGCENGEKTGIYISKVENDTLLLIEEVQRGSGFFEGKWEFIKEYWSKNFETFNY